jgi:adenylate cyclase, class 2
LKLSRSQFTPILGILGTSFDAPLVTVIRRRPRILQGFRPSSRRIARALTASLNPSTLENMSYEVEVKYRLADFRQLEERLIARAAGKEPASVQEDTYLSHPARDFAQTNEALRLRRIGDQNRITYKGPRQSGPTKTREEIEINLSHGQTTFDQLTRLFEKLGFRPVATVRKRRTSFHLTVNELNLEVSLDHAEGLGDFAEIETIAASESDLPRAQQAVLELATQLGLTEVESRSYLRMVLDARSQSAAGPNSAG